MSMTDNELWTANLRAINKRARKHIELARQAQQEYSLVLAYARDALPTPLEAAHAGIALDECRSHVSCLPPTSPSRSRRRETPAG